MKINFTYLAGDGIGSEIGLAALKILNAIADNFSHTLEIEEHLIGGAAIDECGVPLPEETIKSAKKTGAVLLGAVGGPKWDSLKGKDRPELGGLLPLRQKLELYTNIRPAKPLTKMIELSPVKPEILKNVDFIVMRELTGGIYFGKKGRDNLGAYDECRYNKDEIERIAIRAFELAKTRRKKVTSVDKANVLETSKLWRETVTSVAKSYTQIELEHVYVDAMTMFMLTRPKDFDVVLTENMFGDIITDEASVLCGSLGVIPSASLGDKNALYEPIHGSAPDIAGQDKANPIAMILSAAWMLRQSFGLAKEALIIEKSVQKAVNNNELTPDLGGDLGTQEVADRIIGYVNS